MPISYGVTRVICGKSKAVREVKIKKAKGFEARLLCKSHGLVYGYEFYNYKIRKDNFIPFGDNSIYRF